MIQISDNLIRVKIGMFTIKQHKYGRTTKWLEPVINHGTSSSYDLDGLILHEFAMMKAKNVARILLWHYRKQNTPEAYTLEQLEKQIRLALGEGE